MKARMTSLAVLWVLCAGVQAQQPAPPLSLERAVMIAIEKNPARKAALADAHAASAQIQAARSLLLPHLSFSETASRGNDPVYVFGSRLRQQRFKSENFVLSALNRPQPIGNFETRFEGRWNLFNSFASWHGLSQARWAEDAAVHQLDRAEQEIVFRVIASYNEALLSAKRLEVAEQAVSTAEAIANRSQLRFESGLVVESDLLIAKVRLASRRQELIESKNTRELALTQLNVSMGLPIGSSFELAQVLTERQSANPALQDLEAVARATRPDLKRMAAEEQAQRQGVAIARSAFGPRIDAFAGWQLDNPTLVSGAGGNNWVGGIELKIDLFEGGAKRAELARQKALEEKISAMSQVASDTVLLEVRRAYYDLNASRQQIEVMRASIAEAQKSLRINQDRYESGLSTITDLLSAEEAARRAESDYWGAVTRNQISYAALELATGTLNPQSPVVMP